MKKVSKYIPVIGLAVIAVALSACQHKPTLPLARISDRMWSATGDLVDTRLSIKGFRNAELAEARTGIFMEEKYDPSKTPVLLIHGLISEPDTWLELVTELKTNPEITNNFQFLYYAYPTATPSVPAAAILKKNLDKAVKEIETAHGISLHRKMVVIGHSLGGVLAKALISDSGDRLWDTAFNAPIEEFDLTNNQRQLVGMAFRYQPRPYVRNVIFLAAPHRGSALAQGILGRFGTSIAARPKAIVDLSGALLDNNSDRLQPEFSGFIARKVNSIATLRTDSPITDVLAELPIDPAVRFHSIAGIHKPKKTIKSDGVVALESTILEGAYREFGIFSDHDVQQNPIGIDLVEMLLLNDFGYTSDHTLLNQLEDIDLDFIRYQGKYTRQ